MSSMIVLKIKDRKYGMRKMPPLQGSAFGLKVANMISKLASGKGTINALNSLKEQLFAKDGQPVAEMSDKTAMTTGTAILSLLANIDPVELNKIFEQAFSYEVYYEESRLSDPDNFDVHFQKYPGDLYVVALWATYNHVADFFTGLGDGIKALIPSSKGMETDQASSSLQRQGSTTL